MTKLKIKYLILQQKIWPWTAGIENDLDSGFPFWPGYVTPEGKFGIILPSQRLKDIVQKENFKLISENQIKLKNFY